MKGQTKYSRVRQGIINLIACEGILPGQQLPTEKHLAERFDASILTVRHALSQLAENQIVRREQGRGTFVIASLADVPSNGVIALVSVGRTKRGTYLEPTTQQLVSQALAERGSELRNLAVGATPDRETVQMLQNVTGVLATGALSQSWMTLLNSLSLPVVVVGDSCTDKPSPPTVVYNWRKLALMMAEHLLDHGATRLGLITAGDGYAPSFAMRNGLCDLLASKGLEYDPAEVLFAEAAEWGHDVVAFLDGHGQLDGILVEAGFYPQILGYLLDRPQRPQLGVLAVQPPYGYLPASVTYSTFEGEVFTQGVELLFELIQTGHAPVRERALAPRLITREESHSRGAKVPLVTPTHR